MERNLNERQVSDAFPIGITVLLYVAALVIALLWMWLREDSWQNLLSVHVHWMLCLGAGVALGLFVVILGRGLVAWFSWAKALEEEFADLIGPLGPANIFLLALISSVAEEAFFRGAMQPSLGLVLTSIIFGVLHVGPRSVYLPWTIMALGMGFALGILADWSGGLLASIACHFTINAVNLRFISLKAHERLRLHHTI